MIVFTKLLLAHLAGDFILQPDGWVQEKELRKHRSPRLYLHALLHGIAAWLLIGSVAFWPFALTIVVTHFAIDLAKVAFQKPGTRLHWFAADQLLHLCVLAAVWFLWQDAPLSLPAAGPALIILTAALFLTVPSSVIIKTTISQWTPETFYTVSSSLPDAGKFIGYLERLLVLTFILYDHWEAVGFLLAAKSVFRFGDLRESHDRKLTEYVLIGTLLSFAMALAVSILVLEVLKSLDL